MSANMYDLSSNYSAGIRSTNRGAGLAAVKATGNTAMNTTFQAPRDIATLETALQTANAGYYTTARLRTMSKNDMVYALRIALDPATF